MPPYGASSCRDSLNTNSEEACHEKKKEAIYIDIFLTIVDCILFHIILMPFAW